MCMTSHFTDIIPQRKMLSLVLLMRVPLHFKPTLCFDPLEQFEFLDILSFFNITFLNNLVIYCGIIIFSLGILLFQAQMKISKLTNLGYLNKKIVNK